MVGNTADAEDITQNVLLQVVRRLHTYRGQASFTAWLDRVTVNAVMALRRGRARCRERQSGTPLDALPQRPGRRHAERRRDTPVRQVIGRETLDLIERAVARMPRMYRDVFVLADVEGLSNARAAELLGLTLAAVKSRLHRARLLLRAALQPYVH
jgi:RNA polymerase sigma-70 factor (ECF subfamily)